VLHVDRPVAAITLKHISLSLCRFKEEECSVHNYRHTHPSLTGFEIHKLDNKTYWIWQKTEEGTGSNKRILEWAVAYKMMTGEQYLD
jgi:hypothetical protein